MTADQLALFGAAELAEPQRSRVQVQRLTAGLTCLRDAVPEALEMISVLRYGRTEDTRSPCAADGWAWCVCRAGLRFEPTEQWWTAARIRGERWGWNRVPAGLLTWEELTGLVGADPRRAEIAAWAQSIPEPRWRVLERPHELHADSDGWHVSYLCRDHIHPQWPARWRAWQLVRELLTDAMTKLIPEGDR